MDDIILETDGLTKEFRGFVAVSDVSLQVRRGSIHGLIGPNGAGKTTCFNLLTKFLPPTRGTHPLRRARHHRHEAGARSPGSGLVRSFQISAVFPHLSVLENVRLALQRAARRLLRLLALGNRCCGSYDDRARALLDDVGLNGYARPDRRASCPTAASGRWRSPPRWRSSR